MTQWLVAAIIGVMVAALHYGLPWRRSGEPSPTLRTLAFAARATGATLVAALLLDAPAGQMHARAALVALDVSASWRRGGDAGSRYPAARARALELAGDSTLLVGDSARRSTPPDSAVDATTAPRAAADRAREESRPLHLITDGEGALDLALLPGGSRIELFRRPAYDDLALATLVVPERAMPTDTLVARLTIRAGERGGVPATVTIGFDGSVPRSAVVPPLPPHGERELELVLLAPPGEGPLVVRAAVRMPGDAEPRNDSLAAVIELGRAPAATLVSTSPDPDAREMLASLRGALPSPPRGFYLVAPGRWRGAGSLEPVPESAVRRAVAEAPLVVLHGDSARIAPLLSLVRGALVHATPGGAEGRDEWRVAPTADSPLGPALGGVLWDSVPPVDVAPQPSRGDWTALTALAPDGTSRAIVAGSARGLRRTVHVTASGTWRWRARGGRARSAHDALWGGIIDWVAAARPDARGAVPVAGLRREGDPITWRRGGVDSVVHVALVREGPAAGPAESAEFDLRFSAGASTVTSSGLRAGTYVAQVPGGRALLVVNRTAEWLPARQELRDTTIGGRVPVGPARALRSLWWAYGAALAALCVEWMARRRAGLR